MDLEKLNGSYEKTKKVLEQKEKKIKALGKDIEIEVENIEIANADKIVAKRNNDVNGIQKAEKKIKDSKENIEKLKKLVEAEKEEMQMFQDKVDKIVEEIRENPEMQEHLEKVLAKRYSRDIRDVKVKKEKEEKKLKSLEAVQKMVDEHPTMKNHMQGMLNANATINKLNEELSKLDIVKDKDRIDDIKDQITQQTEKLDKNRDGILDFAKKKNLNITKETLDDIMKNNVIDEKTNQVKLEQTLNKNVKASKRQIKGYEKQISNDEKAITNLGYRTPGKNGPTETGDKPKWWQFIKRFNRWNENRKMQSLPDPEEKTSKDAKGEFASSLKYKVVQDIAEQMKQENLREAKREGKPTKEESKETDELDI